MLSILRPDALRSSLPHSSWFRGRLPVVTLLFAVLLASLIPLKGALAQGSFSTNKPFTLSFDKIHAFTLTAIPVTYKPTHGAAISGFLTLSGTPSGQSFNVFSNVRLSFSPTADGIATVTDTFSCGTVILIGANLYCLASVGTGAGGNSFNLNGGSIITALPSTAKPTPQIVHPHALSGRKPDLH